MYFKNKRVLVVGAALGIGRATLEALLNRGAHVVAVDIHTEGLQGFNASHEANVQIYQADIGSDASVRALCDRLLNDGGVPDMIINNAFARQWARGTVESQGLENFQQSFNINVLGFVRVHQALLPHMIRRGHGHLVDTASSLSIVPNVDTQRMLPYIASKGAILGLAYGMRHGLKDTGVHYSVFCPGLTDTRPADAAAISDPSFHAAPPAFAANVLLDGMARGDFLISSEPDFKQKIVRLAEQQLDPFVFL